VFPVRWDEKASLPTAVVLAHDVAGGSKEGHAYPVELTSTPCHFGGRRLWFRCPPLGLGLLFNRTWRYRTWEFRSLFFLSSVTSS